MICYYYNIGSCLKDKACKFHHVCMRCLREGHTALDSDKCKQLPQPRWGSRRAVGDAAQVMRRPTPPLNLGFAGDTGTGAELQRCLAALTERADALSETLITIQLEDPSTWAQALDKIDALVRVPSSTTWSRSRHRRTSGPPPVARRRLALGTSVAPRGRA